MLVYDDQWHIIECDRMLSHATRRRFNPAPLSRNLRTPARTTMKVIPVPVRSDNYAYLLVDEESQKAAAIDPYDLPKVVASAQGLGVEIVACITTHHHDDHSGGNHVREFGRFLAEPFRQNLLILFHYPQAICTPRLSATATPPLTPLLTYIGRSIPRGTHLRRQRASQSCN